jgi:hypothetical protein
MTTLDEAWAWYRAMTDAAKWLNTSARSGT